ncbi:MAG: DUF1801 domain-containing protein [Flavobacteriales bacterium]
MSATIESYNLEQAPSDREICVVLQHHIEAGLPDAESKIWHGHPVWFINGNPIVGYHKLKDCVRLLFWSGQSFDEPELKVEGKFKAAEKRYTDASQIDENNVSRWLQKSKSIQWDYKNIVKRKGELIKLEL